MGNLLSIALKAIEASFEPLVTTPNVSPFSLVVDNTPNTEEEVSKLATPPEIFEPGAIVDAIWLNPHKQGAPGARRESLVAVMEAVWSSEFKEIIEKVLNGQATLADFRESVEAWGRICMRTHLN